MNENRNAFDLKLGIIAGGQLGKMLIQEASKWGITCHVLDDDPECPAADICSRFMKGSRLDFETVYQFGKSVDLLTFEIENIHIEALHQLKAEGVRVVPDPRILELIRDKGSQKEFYRQHGIPTADFELYADEKAILTALNQGSLHYPFVQKLRTGGYDGRGVAVIRDKNDLSLLLRGPSLTEKMIIVKKEIAVIVARNASGEIRAFPPVEMLFDPRANLVDRLACPAMISERQAQEALSIATTLISLLDMQGLLAVEFFIDQQGNVLVNEIAPRPHNSGHHTIESVMTSQYEQHLRAILNLPLGSTALKLPAVMLNILGSPGYSGKAVYEGLEIALALEGVKLHLYGKKVTKPYRKMGHATIIAPTIEDALIKAEKIRQSLKVIA